MDALGRSSVFFTVLGIRIFFRLRRAKNLPNSHIRKKILKKLVTESVFKSFEEAIDAKNIYPEYQFFSLNIERVEKVFVEGNHIKICIKFISEQFKNNDENTVVKKQDSWTFEKTTSSKDPNWLLSST